jgi:CHAT domain-containing protein
MASHADLYSADAFCLLQLEQPVEAWARLESGRARTLGETLGRETVAALRHGSAATETLRTLRRTAQQADQTWHRAEQLFLAASNRQARQAAATARHQAQQALDTAYAALQAHITTLGLEQVPLDAAHLPTLPLTPNTAAITLLLTPETKQVLILHRGTVQTVALPAPCTLDEITRLMRAYPPEVQAWIAAYDTRRWAQQALRQAQAAGETDLEALQGASAEAEVAWRAALDDLAAHGCPAATGWYYAYDLAYEVVRGEHHAAAERVALQAWQQTVARTLAFLNTHLWVPLAAALPAEVTQVLLVPSGHLALLPVHAAAPDHLAVAYAPSLGVWQQCAARAAALPSDAERSLFLATPAPDLFFTQAEAEWLHDRVRALGQPVTWLQQQATSAQVAAQARGHLLVHFSGHAGYRWDEPLASALACADGPLTLSTMRQEMDVRLARLITLSACSTGLSDVLHSGEEVVGLPATLLEAGAPAVVASLWPVHDISTAFLMDRFYELWLGPEAPAPAVALAAASRWLRTATRADLLRRVAASSLSPATRHLVQEALDTALRQEAARMVDATGLTAAVDILSRPDTCPFAAPHYWAAFAAWGAVL